MKKIIVLAPVSSGHVQKWLYNSLDKFEFYIFTLHPGDFKLTHPNLKIFNFKRVTSTRLDFIFAIFSLTKLIKKVKPDLLYSSFLSSYGILGAFVAFDGAKLLSTWGTDVNGKPNKYWLFKKICSIALKKYDWINAPAFHIKEKLIVLGAPEKKIEVFQYGIDINFYEKFKKDSSYDDSLGFNFVSIRNWDLLYNIHNVILGYHKFCVENKFKSTLYIVGKGDSSQRSNLISLISSLNFGGGAVKLVGFLSQNDLCSLLKKSDVVVSIPIMDGTPLSLLESMYVGLYPIVSDIDANREWLNDDTSAIVDGGNLDSISCGFKKSYETLVYNKDYSYLGKNRLLVLENADFNINTNRLGKVFDKFIQCRHK